MTSNHVPRSQETILEDVKLLAIEYYQATGKPLGVTGEIAEVVAAQLFDLKLEEARSPGYDAIRKAGRSDEKIQIKGRWKSTGRNWGRVPSINTKQEFDTVMLVLLSGDFEPFEVWEATREAVKARLDEPGSKSRNERRSMGVSQFKSIACRIWPE